MFTNVAKMHTLPTLNHVRSSTCLCSPADAVQSVRNGTYDALILDDGVLKNLAGSDCSLEVVGKVFAYFDTAFVFNQNMDPSFVRKFK